MYPPINTRDSRNRSNTYRGSHHRYFPIVSERVSLYFALQRLTSHSRRSESILTSSERVSSRFRANVSSTAYSIASAGLFRSCSIVRWTTFFKIIADRHRCVSFRWQIHPLACATVKITVISPILDWKVPIILART